MLLKTLIPAYSLTAGTGSPLSVASDPGAGEGLHIAPRLRGDR